MPVAHFVDPGGCPREAVNVEIPLEGLDFGSFELVPRQNLPNEFRLVVDEESEPIAGPSNNLWRPFGLLANHRHEPLRKWHRSRR